MNITRGIQEQNLSVILWAGPKITQIDHKGMKLSKFKTEAISQKCRQVLHEKGSLHMGLSTIDR